MARPPIEEINHCLLFLLPGTKTADRSMGKLSYSDTLDSLTKKGATINCNKPTSGLSGLGKLPPMNYSMW